MREELIREILDKALEQELGMVNLQQPHQQPLNSMP